MDTKGHTGTCGRAWSFSSRDAEKAFFSNNDRGSILDWRSARPALLNLSHEKYRSARLEGGCGFLWVCQQQKSIGACPIIASWISGGRPLVFVTSSPLLSGKEAEIPSIGVDKKNMQSMTNSFVGARENWFYNSETDELLQKPIVFCSCQATASVDPACF